MLCMCCVHNPDAVCLCVRMHGPDTACVCMCVDSVSPTADEDVQPEDAEEETDGGEWTAIPLTYPPNSKEPSRRLFTYISIATNCQGNIIMFERQMSRWNSGNCLSK